MSEWEVESGPVRQPRQKVLGTVLGGPGPGRGAVGPIQRTAGSELEQAKGRAWGRHPQLPPKQPPGAWPLRAELGSPGLTGLSTGESEGLSLATAEPWGWPSSQACGTQTDLALAQ